MSQAPTPPTPPRVPGEGTDDQCPFMDCMAGRYVLNPSWAGDEEIYLDEAHLYSDCYPYFAGLCYWWAMRIKDPALAAEWDKWAEDCREYLSKREEMDK